jgi:hypothetical protein
VTGGPGSGRRAVRRGILRLSLCLTLALLAGPRLLLPSGAAAAGSPSDTLTILFTGETRGNLLPCACPNNPLGGLARRVRFLRERAEELAHGGLCLRLDAGGFLPEGEVPLRNDPQVAASLVRLLLRGLRSSGIEATVLDYRERAFLEQSAPEEYRRLEHALLDADPPGSPKIIPWGGRKIALLALEESLPDSVIIRAGCLARARADFLIVLGRANAFTGRRVARLARADLAILSRGARPDAPLEEGSALLVGPGAEGREVGEIRLCLDPAGRLRLVDFRLHPMDGGRPEDPEMSHAVADLRRLGGAEIAAGGKE